MGVLEDGYDDKTTVTQEVVVVCNACARCDCYDFIRASKLLEAKGLSDDEEDSEPICFGSYAIMLHDEGDNAAD